MDLTAGGRGYQTPRAMLPPNRKLPKLTSNVTNQRPRRSSLANLAGGRGREILLGTWHVPHRAGPILEGYHVKAEAMHDVAMHQGRRCQLMNLRSMVSKSPSKASRMAQALSA